MVILSIIAAFHFIYESIFIPFIFSFLYLSVVLYHHSLKDGLLAVVGDTLASNYLVIYLTDGRVALTFNADSSDPDTSVTIMTTHIYADSELHALRVVFDTGIIRLTLNGTERLTTECKNTYLSHNKYNTCIMMMMMRECIMDFGKGAANIPYLS